MATKTKKPMTEQQIELENQRICKRLVQREVVHCVSSLVSHFAQYNEALDGSNYSYDDIFDLCRSSDYESVGTEEIDGWDVDELREYLESKFVEYSSATTEEELHRLCIDDAESDWEEFCQERSIDPEELEVYEHWIVSNWFHRKLAEQGETVGELFDMRIWGRCTTGQAIAMDGVIRNIASSMEILCGQKNDWSRE